MVKKRIVVMGGGTAGASAVALLQNHLSHLADITLIDSQEFAPVGVGEATVGNISAFLAMCGLNPIHVCLNDAGGMIKYAVRLKDWYRPGHSYFTPIGLLGMEYHDYIKYQRSESEYWKSWTGLRLGLNGKSPYLKPAATGATHLPAIWPEYAYNIDATAFGRSLIETALANGVTHIRQSIKEVVVAGDDAISHLVLEDGQHLAADFYIDCSGFHRLIPNALNRKITRFEDIPNNRAWATRIPYVDRKTELPYLAMAESQTMSAGWRWQVGLRNRIGTGYVFSSDYLTEDDALREFVDSFEAGRIDPDDCKLIKFDTACYDRQAGSNWITCGLSAGFVEPLESTSIFFIHNNLVAFLALASHEELPPDLQMISIDDWSVPTDRGPLGGWFKWSQRNIDVYNTYTFRTFQTTVDYIAAHYAVSTLDRSAYWNDWRRQRSKYVEIVSDVLGYANDKLFFSRPAYSMLSVGNRLGAVENWDLPRLSVLERQQQRWMSGELSDPRAILADRTAAEAMDLERDYLGTQLHRSYLADQFSEHALDLVDQHQCLEQIDGESPDDW